MARLLHVATPLAGRVDEISRWHATLSRGMPTWYFSRL